MKQMSLIEMDGFLKGKCIPSDLKVNETNADIWCVSSVNLNQN
ncbi:CPS-53 (KpLE1) prophage protein [Escherichia coli]|nr:CPS-53 (KpLE1) prophage protein [Escherichia coli]